MALANPPDVLQLRKIRIDRVQKPEAGYLRSGKLRSKFATLSARAGQGGALGRKDLDLAAQQRGEIAAGCQVEARRDELWIEYRDTSRITDHVRDSHLGKPIEVFIPENQAKHPSRNMDGLRLVAGVLIREHARLGRVAGTHRSRGRFCLPPAGDRDIASARAVFRNREIDIE